MISNRTTNEAIGTSLISYLQQLYNGDIISDHIESDIPQEKSLKKRIMEAIKSDPNFYRSPSSALSNSRMQELITKITAIYAKFLSMQTNIVAIRADMSTLDFRNDTELVDKYMQLAKWDRLALNHLTDKNGQYLCECTIRMIARYDAYQMSKGYQSNLQERFVNQAAKLYKQADAKGEKLTAQQLCLETVIHLDTSHKNLKQLSESTQPYQQDNKLIRFPFSEPKDRSERDRRDRRSRSRSRSLPRIRTSSGITEEDDSESEISFDEADLAYMSPSERQHYIVAHSALANPGDFTNEHGDKLISGQDVTQLIEHSARIGAQRERYKQEKELAKQSKEAIQRSRISAEVHASNKALQDKVDMLSNTVMQQSGYLQNAYDPYQEDIYHHSGPMIASNDVTNAFAYHQPIHSEKWYPYTDPSQPPATTMITNSGIHGEDINVYGALYKQEAYKEAQQHVQGATGNIAPQQGYQPRQPFQPRGFYQPQGQGFNQNQGFNNQGQGRTFGNQFGRPPMQPRPFTTPGYLPKGYPALPPNNQSSRTPAGHCPVCGLHKTECNTLPPFVDPQGNSHCHLRAQLHLNFSIDMRSLDPLKLALLPAERRERIFQEARKFGCLNGISGYDLTAFRKQLDEFIEKCQPRTEGQTDQMPLPTGQTAQA